ncbi:alpha/beta hydrolase [Pelagovum pacificum]|uniref:Alpha/beta hydrolase n=1 Tax=Pelagovum pacificum TaxID=2588711 RepID=A0A5C5G854_9RHOB|nr:alpha/beta fold hydrolase [Pelagovum pacificum]QQA41614.1 alpha/beta hydrolase [Pelagovum pacificum]TNY30894.1 alpha/beta hydrolase [Pelagovum pacificum]
MKLEHLPTQLAEAEANIPGIRPGCEKCVTYFDGPQKTPLSVVYIHGFSASRHEISPIPERIAQELGANLFATRLNGHGIDGAAMGKATFADWKKDMEEAAGIAREIGERTLWIGCSTGATLITLAAAQGVEMAGAMLVSPNFGLAVQPGQWILEAPGIETWGPKLMGHVPSMAIRNEGHARYWTTSYPTQAVFPMRDAVRAVKEVDYGAMDVPALFFYNRQDMVVSPAATEAAILEWGAPVEKLALKLEKGDDSTGHIIAGDIFSPHQTERVFKRSMLWLERLGLLN